MKTFNQFIIESKSCPSGKYWCYTDKKCKKIPHGYHIGRSGYLEKDDEDGSDNGNGSSNGNGGGHGNGNGGNGGGNGSGGGE